MAFLNFEFKARTDNLAELETRLISLNPRYAGEDHQTDTYFNVSNGRLKLREGNIENALIYYERPDKEGAKPSKVLLYRLDPNLSLKEILTASLGIKVIVEKTRKIYFIGNVKFHFDSLPGVGTFIEVEAIGNTEVDDLEGLEEQCRYFIGFFGIRSNEFISESYSDMLLNL